MFWEYSQKKAENSNGIEATKTYNLYQTLLYLNHLFVEENIDNQEIPNQIKEVELRFLRLLYAGLIEIKYVFGSEYPYSKVPNNFWNYRLKYLKDLPFNFLEEQENLDFKELNYYGYSKLNDNYSSVDLVGLDRQDLWNFEYMIKVVEVKKKLIQNLSLLQARNLHVCSVEMKKLGLQINFDAIINDSQKDL
ncbi:hypothetical protein HC864_00125 [Candidatus Gracilibacteria bacterium]|nr:hypothetical protein [Candidatus Gracilibacteria bacterium]